MNKKKIIVLATGGTIAGVGEDGKETRYIPGSITVDEILSSIPKLNEKADIISIQVCNVNSDDITSNIWIDIAKKINELSKDDDVAGFVITHGTDTLEETAYFLNLTVKTSKSVVVTGSMRPSTSLSPDGPMNLYQSVCVALSPEAVGKGVLVVFSNHIYSSRSVQKVNTYDLGALSSPSSGYIGVVRNDEVYFFESPEKRHTISSEFDVSNLSVLPRVSIVYFEVDASPEDIVHAAKISSGIVIAGAGNGEFSKAFLMTLDLISIPIVISSRVDVSLITPDLLLSKNTIASYGLSPQKSALLLRLALTKTEDKREIERIFSEY